MKTSAFAPAVLVVLALAPMAGRAQPTIARLSVETEPRAQVFVDGAPVGRAPIQRLAVTPGSHQIRYEARDLGQQVEFSITLKAGRHLTCRYDFNSTEHRCGEEASAPKAAGSAASQTVDLEANEPAEVFLDGRLIGKTPIRKHRLAPGSYTFEFRTVRSDLPPVVREVTLAAGQSVRVQVEFKAPNEPGVPAELEKLP
jgi:hypothetical protein